MGRLEVFLASCDSSHCAGAEFVIDGGLTAGGVNSVERAWIAKALGVEAQS